MAKKATATSKAKAADVQDKKRRRQEEESDSDSGSDSESEAEQQKLQNKKKQPSSKKQVTKESDSDSDSDDSSDDETENALFRPAAVNGDDDDEEEEESADEAEEEEEEEEPVKKEEPKAAKAKTPKKEKAKSEEEIALGKQLEDEVARKTEATVYIEGIPYKADEGDIVSHFAPCGIVKEVRMPRYQDSGKPRGYAHVVFEDKSSIAKALKLDGKYLFGRYLTVKAAERPRTLESAIQEQKSVKKAVKGCKTVFIKHLPYDTEEPAIREALASCGTVVSVRLPLWNHTKKMKGFGYVEFATEDEAVAAVKRSGMKIGDRMVIISLETAGSAPKASFRTTDGRFWRKGEEAKSSLATKLTEKHKKSTTDHKNKKHKTK